MHGHVVDTVGLAIMRHDFGPSLPNEDALAAELGVSRTALREAMKALAAKGLVELRPRTGTRVLPRSCWNFLDPDVLRWQAVTNPQELIDSTVELRAIIEPAAAALAAVRATEQELGDLHHELERMRRAHADGDTEGFNQADASFHVLLIQMSHNPMLAATATPLRLGLNACFELSSAAPDALINAIPLHRRLVGNLTKRKPEAARKALEQLLAASRDDINHVEVHATEARTATSPVPR